MFMSLMAFMFVALWLLWLLVCSFVALSLWLLGSGASSELGFCHSVNIYERKYL